MTRDMTTIESLDSLADQINTEHRQAESCAREAVAHALKAGQLLTEAKAKVAHGEWLPWLRDNCQVADRTARAYMKLSREYPQLESGKRQRVADLPLREALRYLASPAVDDESLAPETGDPVSSDPTLDELFDAVMQIGAEVCRIEALMPEYIKARKGKMAGEWPCPDDPVEALRAKMRVQHYLGRWLPLYSRAQRHLCMAIATYLEHPRSVAEVDGKPKKYVIQDALINQTRWTHAWIEWSDDARDLGPTPEWAGEMPA